MTSPVIVWLRRDLRLADQPAFFTATQSGAPVIPVYVLDDETPKHRRMGGASRWWLHESLVALADDLEKVGSRLVLLRGDSVAFPPGGCAYLHRHQGPGIRCLVEGGIRIDTHGRSTSYGPGGAWFESGPDSVFAQGATDRATRFVRVMVLPRALIVKSSIQYVNE